MSNRKSHSVVLMNTRNGGANGSTAPIERTTESVIFPQRFQTAGALCRFKLLIDCVDTGRICLSSATGVLSFTISSLDWPPVILVLIRRQLVDIFLLSKALYICFQLFDFKTIYQDYSVPGRDWHSTCFIDYRSIGFTPACSEA